MSTEVLNNNYSDTYTFSGDYAIPELPSIFKLNSSSAYTRGYIVLTMEKNEANTNSIFLPITEDSISQDFSPSWSSNDDNELIAMKNMIGKNGATMEDALSFTLARNANVLLGAAAGFGGTYLSGAIKSKLSNTNSFVGKMGKFLGTGVAGTANFFSNLLQDSSFMTGLYKEMGFAINPNKALYFSGVDMRDFSLNWNLVPLNKEENKSLITTVLNIISYISPDVQNGTATAFFTYPGKMSVKICVPVEGSETPMTIFEQKELAVTNLSFNLGEKKLSTHADGLPVSYNLKISFKESKVPIKENLSEITFLGQSMSNTSMQSALDKSFLENTYNSIMNWF